MSDARIVRVAGALIEARPLSGALYELALVGTHRLLGEIVRQSGDTATIQVYEETSGLALGEPVEAMGTALAAQLGPGLLGSVLDGTGRPLARLAEAAGDFIGAGLAASTLDSSRKWIFEPALEVGAAVEGGDILGTVEETEGLTHAVLVPPNVKGTLASITAGSFTVEDQIGALQDGTSLHLAHRWPIRVPRPIAQRLATKRPFVTGQRVFDLLFPVAEGGACAVPGGFGTGKTSSSNRWRASPTPTSSSTSDAASAATR
jgi:V/A-type H+-transporting ATPase subunit A